jgi:predicted ATPase
VTSSSPVPGRTGPNGLGTGAVLPWLCIPGLSDGGRVGIRTPDQRLRVFLSSTLVELAEERKAARAAVQAIGMSPILFEAGARSHPPRDLYRAYLAQSDVFVGVYWQSYGWTGPGAETSGIEDEYLLAGDRPCLLYVKEPSPQRQPRLTEFIERIEAEGRHSYRVFAGASELADVLRDDLALLLAERFAASPPELDQPSPPVHHRLPAQSTSFVGRETDVDAVSALLQQPGVRLVTLTGPGGIGKTRLAVAVAESVRDAFPDGVTFASVASVRDAAALLPVIASAVGVGVERNRPALDALVQAYDGATALLVVDNLEQVVQGAGALSRLLEACPGLSVLATSRTVLRLRPEHEYPVLPLAVAAPERDELVDRLGRAPAVRLFVDRAAAVRPGFRLDESNVFAVSEICRRLDGLPLAIELAAARVRLLSPASLLTLLASRLDTLGEGPSDLPERQRTLRATMEWSLGLLDDGTARRLDALAVFVNGWTLEAAAHLWQVDEVGALELLDLLHGHSLIIPVLDSDEPRFGFLATVRELLAERLEAGPELAEIRDRHAEYYRQLLQRADVPMRTDGQEAWRSRLEREHGNLRAATDRTIENGDLSTIASMLRQQFLHWWLDDHLVEGQAWLRQVLPRAMSGTATTRAELFVCAGLVAMELGDNETASECGARALSASHETDDHYLRAYALLLRAWVPSGRSLHLTQVLRHLDEAIGLMEQGGESFMLGMALTARGVVQFLLGHHDTAIAEERRALELGRQIRNLRVQAQATSLLGLALLATGHREEGAESLTDSAARFLELDDSEGIALCLSMHAMVAGQMGDHEGAAVAIGAADEQRRRAGISVWPILRPLLDAATEEVRAELGADRFRDVAARGAALSRGEAVAAVVGSRPAEQAAAR